MESTTFMTNKEKAASEITLVYQKELAAKIIDGLEKLYSNFENSA